VYQYAPLAEKTPMHMHTTPWPRTRVPHPRNRPQARQFSLRLLFELMLAAACLLAATPVLAKALPTALLVVLSVAVPLVPTSLPILTVACLRHASHCPRGVYAHLIGMLAILLAIPAICVPPLAVTLLAGGIPLLAVGPVLAIRECLSDDLPPDCHFVAWTTAANAVLVIALVAAVLADR
jgi:hypothetical protein